MADNVMRNPAAAAPAFSLKGHPRGLTFLILTELWERFSYFGLTANLVLYMSRSLLLPGNAEGVVGLGALRAGLEALFGPLTTLALASQIYGLYAGFVYFTPIFGGIVADRWLGRKTAVVLGALLMTAGHFAMAFDASFLLALLLMIVGCGFLKGNISTQVGELYAPDDEATRSRGFQLFSVGINVGAMAGPFVCGLLAQLYGWHVGFATAGVLMLVGLLTYLAGYKHLPEPRPRPRPAAKVTAAPLTAAEGRAVFVLLLTVAITILISIACYQKMNIGLVWIDQSTDLDVGGFRVPVAWFTTIAPLTSIVGVPIMFAIWNKQARRGAEPSDMGKIAMGAWIAAAANAGIAVASLLLDTIPIVVPLAYMAALGMAYLYYWPTIMAVVARAAPPSLKATLMGGLFLSLFAANLVIGWLGQFYDQLGAPAFWAIEAGVALVGGVLVLLIRPWLERTLAARLA